MKLVLKSDHSIEIVGTLEVVYGISGIAEATAGPKGEFELEYDTNGTKIDWNSQSTVRERGIRIFVDEAGNEYAEHLLELIEDVEEDIDDGGPYNEPHQLVLLQSEAGYWRQKGCGTTTNINEAHRYSRKVAEEIKALWACEIIPAPPILEEEDE